MSQTKSILRGLDNRGGASRVALRSGLYQASGFSLTPHVPATIASLVQRWP